MKKLLLFILLSFSINIAAQDTISTRKYKGFVDVGYCGGLQLQTTHGAQILPFLFLGGGIGITYWGHKEFTMPIYGNVRGNLLPKNKISPFADAKFGISLGSTYYLSLIAGCRFKIDKKISINLGAGFEYDDKENFVIRFGIDF